MPQEKKSRPLEHQRKRPGRQDKMRPQPRSGARDYAGGGKLRDKVAIITGADSGIGRAVAVLFAREGADVAIVYLVGEQSDAEETEQAVKKEGRRALLLPGDVGDPDFCVAAAQRTVEEFGHLDILV